MSNSLNVYASSTSNAAVPALARSAVGIIRVALYARVSTTDKDQDPETQLLPLREFVVAQGWQLLTEGVDHARAADLRARVEWARLLTLASQRRFDLLLVWKLDRAFRSVMHASNTLEDLRRWGVALRSYTEPWADTSSPQGELMFNLLATFAQFERALIAERVRAGMERARRQGRRLGRPGGTRTYKFEQQWAALLPRILIGELTQRAAARQLGVARGTVQRLLRAAEASGQNGASETPQKTRENGADPGVNPGG